MLGEIGKPAAAGRRSFYVKRASAGMEPESEKPLSAFLPGCWQPTLPRIGMTESDFWPALACPTRPPPPVRTSGADGPIAPSLGV